MKNKMIIGILGGMGPAATVDLYKKIISCTPAAKDQEHIRVIIDSHPQIPDRTAALKHEGPDPLPYLLDSALKLEQAGVDFIIIPCNTAHAFIPRFAGKVKIPVLNMISICAEHVNTRYPGIRRVGLLATAGTIKSGIYRDEFQKKGITVITPAEDSQENLVMEAIYGANGIKSGNTVGRPHELLLQAAQQLTVLGAQGIIMACTEIPLALHEGDITVPLFDPTWLLAGTAVAKALHKAD
ncbi:MAG: amino acid racemase [Victivallales bacterium]|nr:amino acid racemase [Victivallales bacterium]